MTVRNKNQGPSLLAAALRQCSGAFIAVAAFSSVINVLLLSGSIFMLQVYDRVLPSRSIPTLLALAGLVTGLYLFQGLLEILRGRLLVRIGRRLDESVSEPAYGAAIASALSGRGAAESTLPLRDLDQIRGFLTSPGPGALFDLPWMPFYLGLCFLFHPWIGVTALSGGVLLVAFTLLTEFGTRAPTARASQFHRQQLGLAEASSRNAEALRAMGMVGRMAARWTEAHRGHLAAQQQAADTAGALSALSRIFRMILQSAVLGVGAWLVINQEATAGIMIASSILTSRALAPVELAIAHWRGFQGARQSWRRLAEAIDTARAADPLALPAPRRVLTVESIAVAPPGSQRLVLNDVGFRLECGQALGVIGPSASGKSSLARALVGVWRPARGKVRLDGAALEQWPAEQLGGHIGYLPQDVELFAGTVAENIARFAPDAPADAVLAAAEVAGVHDMILRLPDGYETKLGENGATLSAGQRQRVALARALYGDPFLVVLDEPNANLDSEGEQALTEAIRGVRQRGGVVVVIAHRPSALAAVDLVLAMAGGQVQAFGPKEETLRKVLRAQAPVAMPPAAGARPDPSTTAAAASSPPLVVVGDSKRRSK